MTRLKSLLCLATLTFPNRLMRPCFLLSRPHHQQPFPQRILVLRAREALPDCAHALCIATPRCHFRDDGTGPLDSIHCLPQIEPQNQYAARLLRITFAIHANFKKRFGQRRRQEGSRGWRSPAFLCRCPNRNWLCNCSLLLPCLRHADISHHIHEFSTIQHHAAETHLRRQIRRERFVPRDDQVKGVRGSCNEVGLVLVVSIVRCCIVIARSGRR